MFKRFTAVLSLFILLAASFIILHSSAQLQPASALQGDKYDGDCSGQEAEGRCADKCPPPQFVRGYDDNGVAICGSVTGCPYGDSVPLGPQCDQAGVAQQADRDATAAKAPTVIDTPPLEEFQGK